MTPTERIEQEASEKSNPVAGSGCKEDDHQHDCYCSAWEAGYIAGATSQLSRNEEEAIEFAEWIRVKNAIQNNIGSWHYHTDAKGWHTLPTSELFKEFKNRPK